MNCQSTAMLLTAAATVLATILLLSPNPPLLDGNLIRHQLEEDHLLQVGEEITEEVPKRVDPRPIIVKLAINGSLAAAI